MCVYMSACVCAVEQINACQQVPSQIMRGYKLGDTIARGEFDGKPH